MEVNDAMEGKNMQIYIDNNGNYNLKLISVVMVEAPLDPLLQLLLLDPHLSQANLDLMKAMVKEFQLPFSF